MKNMAIGLSIFLCSQLSASCNFSLTSPTINYTVGDTNSSPVEYALTLNRGNSSDSECDTYMIGFSQGASSSYNREATNPLTREKIPYNLYKSSNSTTMLRRIEDSSSLSQVLSGSIAKNGTVEPRFYFKLGSLSSSSLTRGGNYKDTISLEVDSGERDDFECDAINLLQVNINVPKMSALSLVNSGGTFDSSSTNKTLDFGELTENEDLSFDVVVLSNAGYNLSVSSLNHQYMQLQGAGTSAATQISYLFYANSKQKNISSTTPVSIMTGSGVTPIQGARVPIKISIQSVTGKDPGIYQDYLTFTMATTE